MEIDLALLYFIPIAECLFVNVSDSTDYALFTDPSSYNYQIPLRLTPFDTEYSNSFKIVEFNISLYDLRDYAVDGIIDFTNIIFSVPDPSYELTIDQIEIIKVSNEPNEEYETLYERIWQYSETEQFTSGDNSSTDIYQLEMTNEALFYGDSKWLEYLMKNA